MSPAARPIGGGWIVVHSPIPEHRLSFRIKERGDGRLRIVEILLYDGAGLSGAMLRDLALGAWEAQMNAPEMAALLREQLGDDELFDYAELEWAHEHSPIEPMPLDADDGALELHFPSDGVEPAIAIDVDPQLDLGADQLPSGKRPDAFYRAVAEAYSWLGGHMRHPATELAKVNHVPTSTIHRWVKEARRRGLLGPGRRLVVYDPASPEVLGWAKRIRAGDVSEWDLSHDPVLRAWASRIRKGQMPAIEQVLDPLSQAVWSRIKDEELPPEVKYSDPLVRLVLQSPSPYRDSETQPNIENRPEPDADSDQGRS